MIRFAAAVAASLILTSAAFAGTDLNLPSFKGIIIHGGSRVVLRHGATQRVTVVKGDLSRAEVRIKGTMLDIDPCKNWCWNVKEFVVEVVAPDISNLEVHGGGELQVTGDFPRQPALNVQVHGGGDLDARAIPADTVNAQVHGGGEARVNALAAINAEVHGGGDLSYTGNPARISSQTHGGGSIHKE